MMVFFSLNRNQCIIYRFVYILVTIIISEYSIYLLATMIKREVLLLIRISVLHRITLKVHISD